MTAIEKETTMMCSKDFERCVQCMDCRGVERNAPSQQESTITRKKMVAAHVALIAVILMAPTHEALARGGGGFGGGHGGSLAEVSTVALVWDAASAPMICAPAVIAN
jgi:hypothetical protein